MKMPHWDANRSAFRLLACTVFCVAALCFCGHAHSQELPSEIVAKASKTAFQTDTQSFPGYTFDRPSSWKLVKSTALGAVLLEPEPNRAALACILVFCPNAQACTLESVDKMLQGLAQDLKPLDQNKLSLKLPPGEHSLLEGHFPNGESAAFWLARSQNTPFLMLAGSSLSYFYPNLIVFFRIFSSLRPVPSP